jgi:hypothetical protein
MRNILMSCLSILIMMTAVVTTPLPSASQGGDRWSQFQFLIGNWSGVGSGQPGEAVSGATSFSYDLDKKVVVRKNRAEYAPKPGEKSGFVHEDLLIIYRQPFDSTFRAIYFDNEDHVINYVVSFPTQQPAAVFESEATGKGPRFRLVYELSTDGVLTNEFLIAPPGGEFKS